MSRGDVLLLREDAVVWYYRTDEELEALRERDASNGDSFDSAGEPRLYSRQGILRLEETTFVLITKLRGIAWHAYYNRPRGLVEGVLTTGRWIGSTVVFVPSECKVQ